MIAEKNPSMIEATQTLYELNADVITQEKCRARREYQRRQNTIERDMRFLQEALAKAEEEKALAQASVEQKEEELLKLKKYIEELEKKQK